MKVTALNASGGERGKHPRREQAVIVEEGSIDRRWLPAGRSEMAMNSALAVAVWTGTGSRGEASDVLMAVISLYSI